MGCCQSSATELQEDASKDSDHQLSKEEHVALLSDITTIDFEGPFDPNNPPTITQVATDSKLTLKVKGTNFFSILHVKIDNHVNYNNALTVFFHPTLT